MPVGVRSDVLFCTQFSLTTKRNALHDPMPAVRLDLTLDLFNLSFRLQAAPESKPELLLEDGKFNSQTARVANRTLGHDFNLTQSVALVPSSFLLLYTSKALVPSSVALVPSSFLLLLVRHLLLVAWHLFLLASCYYILVRHLFLVAWHLFLVASYYY